MASCRSKGINILKQNLAGARATMWRQEKEGGDKQTYERAKAIAESVRQELERRGVKYVS